jgi:hypothetical protein
MKQQRCKKGVGEKAKKQVSAAYGGKERSVLYNSHRELDTLPFKGKIVAFVSSTHKFRFNF